MANIILFVGILVFLAHFFAAVFKKFKIPDVLPLMLLGVLVGPVMGWILPEDFGKAGDIFTTIVLIVVLFESGLVLNMKVLKTTMASALRLTLNSFALIFLVIGIVSALTSELTLLEGLVLASILGGISSVIVAPIVERLDFGKGMQARLVVESTVSDALCIIFVLGLLNLYSSRTFNLSLWGSEIIGDLIGSIFVGFISGILWAFVLRQVRQIENSIFATPAFVFIVFGAVETIGWSGALAALAFGVSLGNIHGFHLTETFHLLKKSKPLSLNHTEKNFLEEAVFLLKTFFFMYIGLSINLDNNYILFGAGLLVVLMLILRIFSILISWRGESITAIEASLAAVMIPKGLAAAALASLPLAYGLPAGEIIQSLVFAVILFSVMATAFLVFLLERGWLTEPYQTVFRGFAPVSPLNIEELHSGARGGNRTHTP
ncbi:MAG: cation:proton antiporter [Anaplasmataceae bacterium]|nr:cation:proton antiporter [Anaplasmataceae bacterium]